jgi:hypothetical protein
MRIRASIGLASLCVALAACSGVPHKSAPDARLARVQAVAGQRLGSISFLGSLSSWEPLDDQHVLLYPRPNEAYLLTVVPCPDLNTAISVGVTSRFSRITQGIDSIVPGNMSATSYPCRIQDIRRVDVKALRAADKAASDAAKAKKVKVLPRSENASGDGGR